MTFGFHFGTGSKRELVVAPRAAGPGPVSFSLSAGLVDGTLRITVSEPDLGDGVAHGDGLGVLTGFQWRVNPRTDWLPLGLTAGTWQVGAPLVPGEIASIRVRALGYGGRLGQLGPAQAHAVTGPASTVIHFVNAAGQHLVNAAGRHLVFARPVA